MAKRSLFDDNQSSLTGYLHNISTVTTSNNGKTKFFTGSFQTTKSDVKRLVSFQPEKHEQFLSAAALNSPVKITNSNLSPGKNGEIEVICGKQSTLEIVMDALPFKKQKMETTPRPVAEEKQLGQLDTENISATVCVKVVKFLEDKKPTRTKYGLKYTRNAIVADSSASKKITFWHNTIERVKEDRFYKLTQVLTNLFNGEVWINTTTSTEIIDIEPFDNVNSDPQLMTTVKTDIELTTISINQQMRCLNPNCNKTIKPIANELSTRCANCNMKMKTEKMHSSTTCVLNTSTNNTFMVYDAAIKAFLKVENQQDLINDPDRLEDYFLNIEKFTIEHNKNSNVSISLCRQH